ncbi:hypothetical protein A0256_24190 [Mucilaginibacter sp. PAMC 26640]|nr:hypothetical protein A0256_24190 [Mucilaginibacter sp. PAMC 26640]
MQFQVEIGFDELLERVKKLPKEQILRFKNELDANQIRLTENAIKTDTEDLEAFLLRGPTFSEEQIQIIEETQKAVNKWRKK